MASSSSDSEKDDNKEECYVCGQICTVNSLKSHLKTHTDNHVYRCDDCGRSLKSKKILKKHQTIHQSHYVCRVCYKKFKTNELYERHSCDSKKVKDCVCSTCGKAFYSTYDLNRHIRSHTNEKPFLCGMCGKGFTQKSNRDIHYQGHLRDKSVPPPVREKKYVCDICFQAFGWRQHLNRHRKIHSGVKPYVCSICNRGFNQSTHLKCHLLTHSEEKKFKCDECGQSFKSYTNLYTHRKRHSDPSIFCPVCNKGFYSSSRYDSHYKTHTKTKPYICDICHEKFSVLDSLIQHYLKHSRKQIRIDNSSGVSEIKLVDESSSGLTVDKPSKRNSKILVCLEENNANPMGSKHSQILTYPAESNVDSTVKKPLNKKCSRILYPVEDVPGVTQTKSLKRKRSQVFRLVNPLKIVQSSEIIPKGEHTFEDGEGIEEGQQIVVVELQQIKSEELSYPDCEFS